MLFMILYVCITAASSQMQLFDHQLGTICVYYSSHRPNSRTVVSVQIIQNLFAILKAGISIILVACEVVHVFTVCCSTFCTKSGHVMSCHKLRSRPFDVGGDTATPTRGQYRIRTTPAVAQLTTVERIHTVMYIIYTTCTWWHQIVNSFLERNAVVTESADIYLYVR